MENEIKEKPEKEKPPHIIVRNTADYQRMKLKKLMKNPDKPVLIPERPKERGSPHVPDFVRNVMGSSAGAGSGEFHVYRHLRRKEYARQKFMQEKASKEQKDVEYRDKLEANKKLAEERTAKKRAKRLKKNKKLKKKAKKPKLNKESSSEKSDESCSDEESDHEHEESDISQEFTGTPARKSATETCNVSMNTENSKEETVTEELPKNNDQDKKQV